MRHLIIVFILISILLFSCTTKNNSNYSASYKDSVVKEFLQYTSQSQFYDTTDYSYKILKAHYYNDTTFLRQAASDIDRSKKEINKGFPDSIRRHPRIDKMDIDEAYQLNYSETFCRYSFYFTISKKGNSVNLHSVIYEGNEKPNTLKLFKESRTILSSKQWNDFENLIEYADFWGLTPHKESVGFGGDNLTVQAIIRNRFDHYIIKQHRVDRRFVTNTALHSAYMLLAKFANYKSACDH